MPPIKLNQTPVQWGTEFLVNTTTTGNQSAPTVAALTNGRFVEMWGDDSHVGTDFSGEGVRGQIFNADGSKAGAEFQVNTNSMDLISDQNNPAVTPLADGGFVA